MFLERRQLGKGRIGIDGAIAFARGSAGGVLPVRRTAVAAALVEAGHVRINGVRETAPGHAVKAGDVLTIGLDRSVRVLKITGFSERRGDAAAARVLYDDLQGAKE